MGAVAAAFASLLLALGVTSGAPLDAAAEDHEYRWVDPPAVHAPHNVPPEGRAAVAPPGVETFWTPDLQVQLRWTHRRRAVPVAVEVQPLSVAMLRRLPGGAEPAGNAYRITFDPQEVVDGVVVHLRVPGDIDRIYVTAGPDATWRQVPFEPEDPGIVTVPWEGNGVVLAATASGGSEASKLAAGAAGAAGFLVVVALRARRR